MINYRAFRYENGQLILNKDEINQIALKCIAAHNRKALQTPMPIMADEIAEILLGYTLRYERLTHNESILGTIAFNSGELPVYDAERNDIKYIKVKEKTMLFDLALTAPEQRGRGEFSIAHEVGHAVMHPPSLIDYGEQSGIVTCRNTAAELSVEMPNRARVTTLRWREWQADYFAACLKLPKTMVIKFARECLLHDLGHNLEIIRVMNEDDYDIAEALWKRVAKFFVTSNAAARIRLQELRIIRGLDQATYKRMQFKKVLAD